MATGLREIFWSFNIFVRHSSVKPNLVRVSCPSQYQESELFLSSSLNLWVWFFSCFCFLRRPYLCVADRSSHGHCQNCQGRLVSRVCSCLCGPSQAVWKGWFFESTSVYFSLFFVIWLWYFGGSFFRPYEKVDLITSDVALFWDIVMFFLFWDSR